MAKKIFTYRGKKLEELQALSEHELAQLLPASARRKIKRGFTDQEKVLLKKIRTGESNIKTHCRDMIILPEMVGMTINVYQGKSYQAIDIAGEMIGKRLGEFAYTRSKVAHSAPGIGATRSSSSLSVK